MRTILCAAAALLAACSSPQPPGQPAATSVAPSSCESLRASAGAPGITVDAADLVPAGFLPPGERRAIPEPFCRIQASARPSTDSDIKFEVWMPLENKWNGRFLATGGGGNSGAIWYGRLRDGLERGYATLSTDNGHKSRGGNVHEQSWAIGHPDKVIDFGYRAQAVTASAGKTIIQAFYGTAAAKSYWIGCSQGGGKGLMQAQRFPKNFDGIVAGAPVFDWVGAMFSPAWVSVKGMRDPAQLVPRSKLPMIHKAVLAQCDAADGLADGLLQEPLKCGFEPATLACPAGVDRADCLTPGQVSAMRRFYEPIRDKTGQAVFPGYPRGGELTSAWLGKTEPGTTSWSGLWTGPVFENANYDIVRNLDVDGLADFQHAKQKLGPIYDAVDPDLSAFAQRGGKLIVWHGLHDELVSPLRTMAYVDAVSQRMGSERTSAFMRAYFEPGVNHCRGGVGPISDEYELLAKVVNWVEKGEPPNAVTGTHRKASGEVDRTMPICPYPQVARHDGKGPTNLAGSFNCKAP